MDFTYDHPIPSDRIRGVRIWMHGGNCTWLAGLSPIELNQLINDPSVRSFVRDDYRGKQCVIATASIIEAEEFDGDLENDEAFRSWHKDLN